MVTVIFPGKKLIESWCLGIDVLAAFDESNYENNFGTSKRYPGLQLYRDNGTKIPICWAASSNACMSGDILTLMFEQMDKLGISKLGIDESGKPFYPCMVIDGHPSRLNGLLHSYVRTVHPSGNCTMTRHRTVTSRLC